MTTVLTYIGAIIVLILIVIAFACLILTLQWLAWFHWRSCKHCNHTMEYKGLKPDDGNGHYLFHCPNCGAWEQISKEEFLRSCDESCNPNENAL